jgi:hypothetical protein
VRPRPRAAEWPAVATEPRKALRADFYGTTESRALTRYGSEGENAGGA